MSLVLFDVDGPLILDRTPEFFAWANSLPEISGSWSHENFIETGDWVSATGGFSAEQTTPIFQRFLKDASSSKTRATPGASRAMKELELLTKHIATARPVSLQEATMNFLGKHIGAFSGHHFGVHWEKAELARDINAQFIIDDNHHLLRKVASLSSAQAILFPTRAKRDLSDLNGVTILRAELRVTENIALDSFLVICILAWQEITNILQNGHHQR